MNLRYLLVHSNTQARNIRVHLERQIIADRSGCTLSTFSMADYYPVEYFQVLDKKWKKRESRLMKFYDKLGPEIEKCDVFVHYNGAIIHPEFLDQFKKFKVYHCADDPEASEILSKPVANHYDIHAISNPSCLEMYRSWGCKNVFFWPLGGTFCNLQTVEEQKSSIRDIELTFVGSKYGVPKMRFIDKIPFINNIPGVYFKSQFLTNVKKNFPMMQAYGCGWPSGLVADEKVPHLYARSLIGLNLHNSLGPINSRLYDLAAFGVCQICDNEKHLHHVFDPGLEIIGYSNLNECIEKIRYYASHREEAIKVGLAARVRYEREYTVERIWTKLTVLVERFLAYR